MRIKGILSLRALIAELQDWNDFVACPAFSECPFLFFCLLVFHLPWLFLQVQYSGINTCFGL